MTDFVKLNGHIRSSFLFHLCVQNSLFEEKGNIKTSKSIVQTKVEEELIRLRFDALPVVFVGHNQTLYCLPINLKEFRSVVSINETRLGGKFDHENCLSSYEIAKINLYNPEIFQKLSLTDLLSVDRSKYPSYLDKNFVIRFFQDVLKPKLDPFYQLHIKKSGLLPGKNSRCYPEETDRDASFPAQPEFTSTPRIKSSENSQILEINSERKPEIVDSTRNSNLFEPIIIEDKSEAGDIKIEGKDSVGKIKNSEINMSTKFTLDKWSSIIESGDPQDWIRNSIFVLNLHQESAQDSVKISHLLNSIQNVELKSKCIDELSNLNSSERTLEKFKEIFTNHTSNDTTTYRHHLKDLKYDSRKPFHDLFGQIFRLVYKSMNLDPIKDKLSVDKIAVQLFLEKIPNNISSQLQSIELENSEGIEIAKHAERIRSFQRTYLNEPELNICEKKAENQEINLVRKFENNMRIENYKEKKLNSGQNLEVPTCHYCGKRGHIKRNCFKLNNRDQSFGKDIKCFTCGRSGHKSFDCRSGNFNGRRQSGQNWAQNQGQNTNFKNQNYQGQKSGMNCFFCDRSGHSWEQCWLKQKLQREGKISPDWRPENRAKSLNNYEKETVVEHAVNRKYDD